MKNNELEYKGYKGKVEFDPEARIFHGEVFGMRDIITFQGTTPDEIIQAFQESIDDYLDWCKERGETPEKPYSGRFNLRIDPELHKQLAIAAGINDESLNLFIIHILSHYLKQQDSWNNTKPKK